MAVAQESEFLAVNQKIRVRIPAVTPFHNARDAEAVEAAACKPALTRCESGRALHYRGHRSRVGRRNGIA